MRCPISPAPAERNSVNALALELLGVAKEYPGPAAPAFLSRELHALGVTANTVDAAHVLPLAERARQAAAKVMDNKKAGEFAQALAKRGGRLGQPRVANDHRLASEAAASLFVSGHLLQAEAAYRELVRKYGDVDAMGGLARTLQSLEDFAAALSVLREGAGAFARKGDRGAAARARGTEREADGPAGPSTEAEAPGDATRRCGVRARAPEGAWQRRRGRCRGRRSRHDPHRRSRPSGPRGRARRGPQADGAAQAARGVRRPARFHRRGIRGPRGAAPAY